MDTTHQPEQSDEPDAPVGDQPHDAPSDLPPAPDQPAEGGVATVNEALRRQGLPGADDD